MEKQLTEEVIKYHNIEHEHSKCCMYWYTDDLKCIYISSLHIDDAYRGIGLATKILNEAIGYAREHSFKDVYIMVFNHTWIIDWYRRFGFSDYIVDNDDQDYSWLVYKL